MSRSQEKILIVGAGAIGRGFLAPYFVERGYEVRFAEKNLKIIEFFNNRPSKSYQTAVSKEAGYEILNVPFLGCSSIDHLADTLEDTDYIFFCVGIKELENAAEMVSKKCRDAKQLKAIYSVENEPLSVEVLKPYFQDIAKINFGVPDVITSSLAPENLLDVDPLCVVSEQGALFLEGQYLKDDAEEYSDDYVKLHWICKKYLHNTPHAAIAYLGAENNYRFIHEACRDENIERIILRLLKSIQMLLEKVYGIAPSFLAEYAIKEMKRFKDVQLCDPIERVGRNPEIKLKAEERIVHIASLFQEHDLQINDISRVIYSAFQYEVCEDFNQVKTKADLPTLIENICKIDRSSILGKAILAHQ